MTNLQNLSLRWDHKKTELTQLSTKMAEAKSALEAEEVSALVDNRPINEKIRRRLFDAADKHANATADLAILDRAIAQLRQKDDEERSRLQVEALKAFRDKSAEQIKRVRAAAFELRNAVQAFGATVQAEAISVNWPEFLFPYADPANGIEGMQVRSAQASMLIAAERWISDDIMHSRLGPQQYKEAR